MRRVVGLLDHVMFAIALCVLIAGAAGGPAWSSGDAILAAGLQRSAAAPLYDLVAGVAAYLPVGEPGFRLATLSAVLGAVVLVGVVRAARALLPKDPLAGLVAAIVLGLAPAFRDAAGFAGPTILAACGLVWTLAFCLEHARKPAKDRVLAAMACIAVVIGSAPWLGALAGMLVVTWLWRTGGKPILAHAVFGVGALIVVGWLGALGSLPALQPDLGAVVAASGRGAGAIVVGAGLLGIAFAAITNLRNARWMAAVVAIAFGHAVLVDHEAIPVLSILALGCAIVPSAIVQLVGTTRRTLVVGAAAIPIIGAAILAGPAFAVDDPGAAPARLASDLTNGLPAGPGAFIATRSSTWGAVEYAQRVAGVRPDLPLAPPLQELQADAAAAQLIRTGQIAGADTFAFGRLDPRFAVPRSRGFQLLDGPPKVVAPILIPPHYDSQIGREEGLRLMLDRGRYEAVNGRLGVAARVTGLASTRFGAADLAILATTEPSRPALFAFIPNLDGLPPGDWMIQLFGDDLAWTAGIDEPAVDTPRERKLHALWRALWRGEIKRDDPAILALGPAAVQATDQMLATYTPPAK
ncbi:MAG: hypothetical protein ABI867_13275 [Kofleriaceae bacterium]